MPSNKTLFNKLEARKMLRDDIGHLDDIWSNVC